MSRSFSKTADEVVAEIERRVTDYQKLARAGGEDSEIANDIIAELQSLRHFMIRKPVIRRGVDVKERDGRFFVRVENYTLRNGWVHVEGPSHRSWVVTVDQVILDWLAANGPATRIIDEFLHDDYPCYFTFWFEDKQLADNFASYLNTEWKDDD